jgi:hypothetical protein
MPPASPSVCRLAPPAWSRDPRAWPLVAVGGLLVASGLAHVVVWGVMGGPWEGAVTWRKPILFGISGGLTAVSLGWGWSCLARRRGDTAAAWITAGCLAVEVLLIDLQRWRGVASHFNRSTRLDSVLYDLMGLLILVVTLAAIDLAVRSLVRGPQATRPGERSLTADMLLALRAGLWLLVLSCGLGVWVSLLGDIRVARGLAPERLGAAGVPKFPHGVAIHAIQWLPILAWAAGLAGIAEARRRVLVGLSAVAGALLVVYALWQTLAGRDRFDASPATACLLALAVVLLAWPVVAVTLAFVGVMRSSAAPGRASPRRP